jgi:hypothetical protein
MAPASAFSPTIRGRDAELAALGEQFAQVRSGSGSVLLIEGAAGMGKSRLITEGVRMAQRLSCRPASARPSLRSRWLSLLLCSGRCSTDRNHCSIARG